MRFKTHSATAKHAQMVTAVGWTPATNKLYTCSDDQTILSWAADGSLIGKVADTEYYVTDMSLFAASKAESLAATSPTDMLVLACSDGAVRLMTSNGRVEKTAQLHQGAVTAVKWNNEGTGIATAGEDGLVTYCSAAGLLRSKLATNDQSVYALCWAPDNLSVLFSCGQYVTIKPLQASSKQTKWKAHDGVVLKADWNSVNKLIVTAGEDGRYKVWDSYGRSLFVSRLMDMPITSVSWSPNGHHFAVGSFDSITLCDKTGWVHSRDRLKSGSILSIDWTSDGTQLAAAGAAGNIVFGQIVDRKLEWGNFDVSLTESTQVVVRDMLNDNSIVEELEFGERVVDLSIAHGHLVIATTKLCYVYSVNNFSAPHVFEVRGAVSLILQCPRSFLLVDTVQGIQIFNYEGKILCTPRRRGLLPKFLQHGNIALSNDVLAIVDRQKPNQILLLDAHTGTELREPLIHNRDAEVVTVALNQGGLVTDRKLVYIDSNRDLFLVLIQSHGVTHHKLASMVDTVVWHDSVDLLAAISDGKFLVWYYPNAVFMDVELLKLSRVSLDASVLGKNSEFLSFSETRAVVRRSDGAAITLSVSPFPAQLHACAEKGAWSKALRLCRMIKDPPLWASLAAMAVHGHELQTAEIAFSAIDEVDKVEYLQSIMDIPTIEGRNAEIAAFCHRPDDAENILLQANLVYRAIKLNIRLFRWERALDLAVKYKTHVDTVLAYRQRFLESSGRKETLNRFIQYSKEVRIDWDTIQAKKQQEYDRERAYAVPYQSAHAQVGSAVAADPSAYAPPPRDNTDRSRAPSSRRTSGTNNVSVPGPQQGRSAATGRDRASPTFEVMRVSGDDVEIAHGGPAEEESEPNGWVHARDDRLGSDEFVRVDLNPNDPNNNGDDGGDDAAL